MCGLVGTLLYPERRSPEALARILEITTANLVGNEERGREASGIAVVRADGAYRIFKQPVESASLVQMEGYQETLASVDEGTTCILGHTRMPTKGSRWHNANNHPIVAGHIIGIHNGQINNDDALFERYDLPRSGEVDSEIIFRLQDLINPTQVNGQYRDMICDQANVLNGRFATLSLDLRRPHRLIVLKYKRPLCLHYEPELKALFFSSRYIFLRRAFGRSVITEALDSDFGYCFDARRLPDLKSVPVDSFALAMDGER
jgi:glucosamine 6-phosphate synthetase-like amidotransferase/phosphosugar isomerase protein